MNNTYHIFGLYITSAILLPAPLISNSTQEFEQDVIIAYGKTPAALTNPQFKGVRFQAGPG
ncbi:MAG: hypothetical protein NTU74_12010, partial [Deltaproteobacteria bacterium]|nr:hypothetical protein [Deltaproteobacteria bacterium]